MQYNFEWDPSKAKSNLRKHGVAFEAAAEVFGDPLALTVFDDENSVSGEDRWVTLGKVKDQCYLVVVHTFRSADGDSITIRIISARPATRNEVLQYENGD